MMDTNTDILHTADSELMASAISRYPWYALARARLIASDTTADQKTLCLHAIHFHDRAHVFRYTHGLSQSRQTVRPDTQTRETASYGSDYFNRDDLKSVRQQTILRSKPGEFSDTITFDLAASDRFDDSHFYTETLARIYADQGLNDRAIDIYSKLCLLNPEKNTYFAGLIDKLKSKK